MKSSSSAFFGVVGVDVFIVQLNQLVLDFFANGDYVIITNNYGNVILHPNAHKNHIEGKTSYLQTLTLSDVEYSPNKTLIAQLARQMIDRVEGRMDIETLFYLQSMPKGEETLLTTVYYHGPIPNTPFSFAIASRHKLGFLEHSIRSKAELLSNLDEINMILQVNTLNISTILNCYC